MACQPTNNNDLRSFGEVFAEEHLKQGGNGSFWYKGKKFSTKRSDGRDLRKERLAKEKNALAASCHCVGSNNNNNNSVTKPEMECKQTMLDLTKEKNIKDICAIVSSIAYDGLYKTPKSKYNSKQRRENSFSKCINVNGYKGLIDKNFAILYSNQDMFGVKMHGKIFVGFRGTAMTNVRDIGNDLINICLNTRKGFGKRHDTCSKLLKNEIIDKYGNNNNNNNNNIILTGHSLGGHLAESLAIEYDLYAYTFNAPGINIASKIMFGGDSNNNMKKSDKIYSYKIKGDNIGMAGESLGKNVIIQEQSDATKGSIFGKHSMKNFLPDAGQCFDKITTQLDRQIVQEVEQYQLQIQKMNAVVM